MSKEMNWIYVKENYGKLFKENFDKESDVLDVINIDFSKGMSMSQEELLNGVQRLECEMRFLVDNFKTNLSMASKLSSWCLNMVQNLMYYIDSKTKGEE